MTEPQQPNREVAGSLVRVCRDDGEPLVQILISPAGTVESTCGDFVLDQESFELIDREFKGHGIDLVIDYEHQTLGGEQYSSPSGRAPAAGWIKSLTFDASRGLLASVEWTDEARNEIRSKQYKYLSPAVIVRKKDRRAVELHSAALTNKPAIKGMAALAAKQHQPSKEKIAMADVPETSEVTPDQKIGKIEVLLRQKGIALDEGVSRDGILDALIGFLEGSGEKMDDADKGGAATEDTAVAASVRTALGLGADADKSKVTLALTGGSDAEEA